MCWTFIIVIYRILERGEGGFDSESEPFGPWIRDNVPDNKACDVRFAVLSEKKKNE
jgi:hypothetical protein